MGNSSSNRRGRTRDIRARMSATGEPYSVAARRLAAEQTSPAGEVPLAAVSPSRITITMDDIAVARDELLDWAYDQARGDTTNAVHVLPFTQERGLDVDAGFTLVDICEAARLVRAVSTFGNPTVLLTPAGIAHVQARRRRREDPGLRATAARTGLLRWMYGQHTDGVHMPHPSRFATAAGAHFEGRPFTEAEISHAAEYLAKRELIKGPGAFGHRGPLRADITPDGMDCVVDWSADVSAYLRRQETTGSTSTYNGPVFNAAVDGTQIAYNNNSVNQNITRIEQVAPEHQALAQALTQVMNLLVPQMHLSPEAQEDVEAANAEIVAEIVRDEPRPGPIRRGVTLLRNSFTALAAATAVGATAAVSDEAQDAARQALELLSPF